MQEFDSHSNCFPSMHVSVATLTAFHLIENTIFIFGANSFLFFLFPFFIGLSTLYTKQHYFFDIPSGAALGLVAFKLYQVIAL